MTTDTIQARKTQLITWLEQRYPDTNISLEAVSGDASFRHYYRFLHQEQSFIALDSPPTLENNQPFIDTSELLFKSGINVPELITQDKSSGFFILTDFGDHLLLPELNLQTADRLYGLAIDTLMQLQTVDSKQLPVYDEALLTREMQLFSDWYLIKHKGFKIDTELSSVLSDTFQCLITNALEQPQVFVHRDYHSRNLMLLNRNLLGVIDHQDAVLGPITYDLVSLLRDCYIAWPQEKVDEWVKQFFVRIQQNEYDLQQFTRWFDLMGAQRHLKAIGIFCRLKYRDGKTGYIDDIPRTLNYLSTTTQHYPELQALHQLILRLV